jgi:metal-dependent HD superfamily phosphatase/phosphodiesterase
VPVLGIAPVQIEVEQQEKGVFVIGPILEDKVDQLF